VIYMIEHEQYEDALKEAYEAHCKDPDDAEAADLYRRASFAWLLERGRRLTFEEADEEALELFLDALELEPGSRFAVEWIAKTNAKITTRWLNHALELESNDHLVEAREAYYQAIHYHPNNLRALEGAGRMTIRLNYRVGLGEKYYTDGVRAFSRYQLEEARSGFDRAEKYAHAPERTARRMGQVRELLATQRIAIAESLAGDDLYAAARNEYRLALVLDPDLEGAQAGFERMGTEAEAKRLLEEARMLTLRRRFRHAREALAAGRELTERQIEAFDGMRDSIKEETHKAAYEDALTLEDDYRYDDAIAAYGTLLKEAQFYQDVRARKETLEEYVRIAADLYERAAGPVSDDERLRYLQQIEIFWPEYLDIQTQLTALKRGTSE